MKITSVNNELIKNTAKLLQRKYRDEQGLFISGGIEKLDREEDENLHIVRR